MPGYAMAGPDWEPGDPRTPVPDEQVARERDAIREVVRRLLSGESLAAQLAYLNDAGHRTYVGRPWTAVALRSTLRRPALAGIAVHHGEEVGLLPGEPVLDRETFDRLQSFLDSRKRGRPASDVYLLSGVLKCGRCGHTLAGRPRVARNPYPETGNPAQDADRTPREYWCMKRTHHADTGCGRLSVDQRFADEVVTEAVLERLSDPETTEALAAHDAQVEAVRAELGAEVARLDGDADVIAEKAADWGPERVDKALRPLLARITALRARLDALDAPTGPTVDPLTVAADWREDSQAQRRAKVRRAFPTGITVLPADPGKRGTAARTVDRFVF